MNPYSKYYLDLKSALDTSFKKGILLTAKNAIKMDLDNSMIHQLTGLSIEEIEQLRDELK